MVLEHAVKDVSVEWVLHGVLGELFKNVSFAEWGSVGLSIVLNGMVKHQPDLSASQKLFGKHLRSKVSADLAPEADKLAAPMTLIEWRKFCLKAKEGTTTSVVSGLHRGHYKTCATNDIIATMQMTIVSLAFEFGLKGVHRWHSSVD